MHNATAAKVVVMTVVVILALALIASLVRFLRGRLAPTIVEAPAASENSQAFAAAAYQGVILKLREDEKKLQARLQQAQENAAASDNINQTVLTLLSNGVVFFDCKGMVRQVNPAARSLLGYASPYLLHVRDIFRGVACTRGADDSQLDDGPAALVEGLLAALQGDGPFSGATVDYTSPAGQRRVLGITATVARMKTGEIQGLACVINDLTEVADLSQQVERSESLASLGEISAGIVNDFNNSLATISGYAQMLMKEKSTEPTHEYARKIVSEAESLTRIVGQFLEFAGTSRN